MNTQQKDFLKMVMAQDVTNRLRDETPLDRAFICYEVLVCEKYHYPYLFNDKYPALDLYRKTLQPLLADQSEAAIFSHIAHDLFDLKQEDALEYFRSR